MQGILFINLGTPDNPSVAAVRRFLREFLSDPRVLPLPKILRYILLYGFILPFRPKQSAKAYQAIWSKQGSPLRGISEKFLTAVRQQLGKNYKVSLGMRYGNPSITAAIAELQDCEQIIILPLFPQYSSAATGSAIEHTLNYIKQQTNIPSIKLHHNFFADANFIQAYSDIIKENLAKQTVDFYLFSYHGLTVKQIQASEASMPAACKQGKACPKINSSNNFCYRAQCFATSNALAQKLSLKQEQYQTSFQSRLGKTAWILPYTDQVLPKLIEKGIKNLAIICPSFVVDCLETLEEIGIRARNQWQDLGGNKLHLVPCLNAHPAWIQAIHKIITNT